MRSFLILHGLGGSGPTHWQAWLYQELLKRGEKAYFPDFPDKDHPDKAAWLERLNSIFLKIPKEEEIIVVAHSLACINWFHYAASGLTRSIKKVILVAPPSAFLEHEPIKAFLNLPDNKEDIAKAAEKTLLILSSNDPYCSAQDAPQYLDLGIPCIILPNMGHINVDSGFGPWPWMLDLCLNERIGIPYPKSGISLG